MDSKQEDKSRKPDEPKGWGFPNPRLWLPLVLLAALISVMVFQMPPPKSEITYSFYFEQLKANNIKSVRYGKTKVTGEFKKAPLVPQAETDDTEKSDSDDEEKAVSKPKRYEKHFWFVPLDRLSEARKKEEDELLEKNVSDYGQQPESQTAMLVSLFVYLLLPIGLVIFLFFMFRRTRDQIMGGGFLSGFSKSTAERYEKTKSRSPSKT
jgi:cell division protease FtsH